MIDEFVKRTKIKPTSKVYEAPSSLGFTVIHANKESDVNLKLKLRYRGLEHCYTWFSTADKTL